MNLKITISNILILVAALFTLLASYDPSFYQYGLNDSFIQKWDYHIFLMQIFTSQFLHGWIIHLIMNAIFILVFWSVIENMLGEKKYIFFFVFTSIFIWIALILLSSPYTNTVWISGFVMAIVAYHTLDLKSKNHPDYKGWITVLIINILFWFAWGVSLLGHLFGAISWVIYYYILRILKI